MIALPWYVLPWSAETADLAHALVAAAKDGNPAAKAQLADVMAQAHAGSPLAREAWRCFKAIIQLVNDGQPPPSVIRQLHGGRGAQVGLNGGFPGGVPLLPWGFAAPWNYGFDPFALEEEQRAIEEAAADADAADAARDAKIGQNPPNPMLNFGLGPLSGVPLLPFGHGPWNYGFNPLVDHEVEFNEGCDDEPAAPAGAGR